MTTLEASPAHGEMLGTAQSVGRGRPRLLLVAFTIGHMAQGLAFTACVAALPQMAHDLGAGGEFVAQMTIAVAALGLLVGALASGWILDRAGTRGTLLTSIVVFGVTGAGAMVLRDPVWLLASRFAVGFAAATMTTTCLWGIAAEYTGNGRARMVGIANSVGSLASFLGTVLGGILAQRRGWAFAFIQYPVFALVAFVIASLSIRQIKPTPPEAGARSEPYFARLLPFFLLASVIFLVMFMGSTQFAFLLQEDGIQNPAIRGPIMSMLTVVSTLTSFAYGWIHQRLGSRGTFLCGLVSAAVSLTLLGASPTVVAAIVGASLLGIYVGLAAPYVYHTVTERTESSARGRALGVVNAFGFFGGFLNPVILAPLSKWIGIRGTFFAVAVVVALIALGAGVRRAAAHPAAAGGAP
jgi:MFS family permease